MFDEIIDDYLVNEYISNIPKNHPEVEHILQLDCQIWQDFQKELLIRRCIRDNRLLNGESLIDEEKRVSIPNDDERFRASVLIDTKIQLGEINSITYMENQ